MTKPVTATSWLTLPWMERYSGVDDSVGVSHWVLFAMIVMAALAIRLHDLAAVGIFQDEKYMVLSVHGVLETGLPYLPSGMFYPRALGQIYLMAGSVSVFGEGVWAYRFPSVVAGTLCVVLAYVLGRRHMGATMSLAFAATFAFLPNFVEVSQIARMYVFLVLTALAFLLLLSEWIRTGGWLPVIGVVLVIAIGIEFQRLAIFLLPLAVLPLLIAPSWKRLAQTSVVMLAGALTYNIIEAFVARQYANSLASESVIGSRHAAPLEVAGFAQVSFGALVASVTLALVAIGVTGWLVYRYRGRQPRGTGSNPSLFLTLGALGLVISFLAAALMSYKIAAFAFLGGAALVLRSGVPVRVVAFVMAAIATVAATQSVWILTTGDAGTAKEFALYFLSFPSPGPEMTFVSLFPGAVLVFLALLAVSLTAFAHGRPVPYEVLLVTFGVIVPMMVIGVMLWAVAPRYLYGVVPVFLFALFLAVNRYRYLLAGFPRRRGLIEGVVAVGMVLTVVSPYAVVNSLDRSYTRYPDHVGAAAFVRDLDLSPSDVVVVFDAPIQTYYLSKVDYLLRYIDSAAWQARDVDGQVVDIFTGTPVLFQAEHFESLLQREDRGDVYVIGSGEIHGEVSYGFNLGPQIPLLFERYQAEPVFTGRDGKTHVWLFPASSRETGLHAERNWHESWPPVSQDVSDVSGD